jgi:cation diffusion facilitator CzcD-associated flavoprotein CzcO
MMPWRTFHCADSLAQYATRPEIWDYMKATAKKWELEQYVRYHTKVTDAVWADEAGKWNLKLEFDGRVLHDECDVLVNATGIFKFVNGADYFHGQADSVSASASGRKLRDCIPLRAC